MLCFNINRIDIEERDIESWNGNIFQDQQLKFQLESKRILINTFQEGGFKVCKLDTTSTEIGISNVRGLDL